MHSAFKLQRWRPPRPPVAHGPAGPFKKLSQQLMAPSVGSMPPFSENALSIASPSRYESALEVVHGDMQADVEAIFRREELARTVAELRARRAQVETLTAMRTDEPRLVALAMEREIAALESSRVTSRERRSKLLADTKKAVTDIRKLRASTLQSQAVLQSAKDAYVARVRELAGPWAMECAAASRRRVERDREQTEMLLQANAEVEQTAALDLEHRRMATAGLAAHMDRMEPLTRESLELRGSLESIGERMHRAATEQRSSRAFEPPAEFARGLRVPAPLQVSVHRGGLTPGAHDTRVERVDAGSGGELGPGVGPERAAPRAAVATRPPARPRSVARYGDEGPRPAEVAVTAETPGANNEGDEDGGSGAAGLGRQPGAIPGPAATAGQQSAARAADNIRSPGHVGESAGASGSDYSGSKRSVVSNRDPGPAVGLRGSASEDEVVRGSVDRDGAHRGAEWSAAAEGQEDEPWAGSPPSGGGSIVGMDLPMSHVHVVDDSQDPSMSRGRLEVSETPLRTPGVSERAAGAGVGRGASAHGPASAVRAGAGFDALRDFRESPEPSSAGRGVSASPSSLTGAEGAEWEEGTEVQTSAAPGQASTSKPRGASPSKLGRSLLQESSAEFDPRLGDSRAVADWPRASSGSSSRASSQRHVPQEGSQGGSQAGSQARSQAGSQTGSQARSQAGSQTGSQARSQAGTHGPAQLPGHPDVRGGSDEGALATSVRPGRVSDSDDGAPATSVRQGRVSDSSDGVEDSAALSADTLPEVREARRQEWEEEMARRKQALQRELEAEQRAAGDARKAQGQPPAPRPATPSRPSTPASPRSVAESPAPGVADPFGFGGGMAFVRGFGMPRGSGRSSAGPATPHALVAPPIGVAAEDTVLVAKRPTSARGRATPSALAALQKAAGASTPTAAETSIPGFDEEDLEDLGMAPAARPSTAPSQSVARAAPADDAGGPPEDVRKMLESSESSDSASDSGSDFGAGGRGAGATRASPRADAGAVRQALRSPHPPQPATTPTAFLGKSRLGGILSRALGDAAGGIKGGAAVASSASSSAKHVSMAMRPGQSLEFDDEVEDRQERRSGDRKATERHAGATPGADQAGGFGMSAADFW